jgi:bifunctional DNA-binding transcriptional regulator/antitoxin component of YhaV-PrlF toxin-antitoxin module
MLATNDILEFTVETDGGREIMKKARDHIKSVYDSDPRWKKFDWWENSR